MARRDQQTQNRTSDPPEPPTWRFLTNHALVLLCIAEDSGIRVRDIAGRVGITERAAHRIVGELVDAGYIGRRREGRRNLYTVNGHFPLPDPIAGDQRVDELLRVLVAGTGTGASSA